MSERELDGVSLPSDWPQQMHVRLVAMLEAAASLGLPVLPALDEPASWVCRIDHLGEARLILAKSIRRGAAS